MTSPKKNFITAFRVWNLVLALLFFQCGGSHAAETGVTFPTPEAAVTALSKAAAARDRDALRSLFGLDTDELVAVDQVQATNDLAAFSAAFAETNRLVRESDTRYVLEVGRSGWPFPVQLQKKDNQWFFDTDAGKEELLNRRIGRNELAVLQVVRAYVEAQREYASVDRNDDSVLEYAQKISSSPGMKDGLLWSPDLDGDISPLGPLVAEAQGAGYAMGSKKSTDERIPFHGYYFKILLRQGKHAPGGKYDYVINGHMIAGFALVAWPATYGESGIMTFIVNQQGRVYQKDIGSRTAKEASSMSRYDPGPGWQLSPD